MCQAKQKLSHLLHFNRKLTDCSITLMNKSSESKFNESTRSMEYQINWIKICGRHFNNMLYHWNVNRASGINGSDALHSPNPGELRKQIVWFQFMQTEYLLTEFSL